jgi:hypothetical protein
MISREKSMKAPLRKLRIQSLSLHARPLPTVALWIVLAATDL